MRLANWLLHLLIVALLCVAMRAQTQGNRPELIDSYQSDYLGSTTQQIPLPDGVNSGEELVACVVTTNTGLTVSDILTNTWTKTAEVSTPAPSNNRVTFCSYTNSASSGADTVILSGSPTVYAMTVGRFKGVSGVLDGTMQSNTYTGNTTPATGGPGSFTVGITTTVNGDLLIGAGAIGPFGTSWIGRATGTEYVSNNNENDHVFQVMQHTSALGAKTIAFNTFNDFSFGSHATFAGLVLAFKPTAIAVVDTAMPDAAAGVAYSAQLHGVGGIAGLTYACTGLPSNGLSLNTGTGVISGATPTIGSVSIGCTVTDGTSTSATNSLTIVIGAGFNSPILRQTAAISQDGGASNGGTFSLPVTCGDVIAVYYYGSDTHSSSGWVLNPNGAQNKVIDSQGNVYSRVGPLAGTNQSPLGLYEAVASQSGALTVTIVHNTTAGSGLNFTMADLGNVQGVVDVGTDSNAGSQSSSPFNFTDAYTTVVPNQYLAMATSSGFNNGDTIGYSPLSVSVTNTTIAPNTSALGFSAIGSASTFTGTATIGTGGWLTANPTIVMHAFRPALPSSACNTFTGPGEKIRRQVW